MKHDTSRVVVLIWSRDPLLASPRMSGESEEEARNRDAFERAMAKGRDPAVALAFVRSVLALVRAKWSSRSKDLDGLLLTAREAMRTKAPDERYLKLSRIMLDVSLQKRREPLRAASAEAALLDLVLESLHAWLRREPQLAPGMNSMITNFEDQRAALGDGQDRFEEEVAAIRSSLYP